MPVAPPRCNRLELAREVVLGPTRENVLALADAVLADEHVRIALEVREGGSHAVRRAIELAALVLSAHACATDETAARSD